MKVKITIIGDKVHNIGYRYFLMEGAILFSIERFKAINLMSDRQVLHVFAEGDDEDVTEFGEFVKTNYPSDAEVNTIEIGDYKGSIPKLESFALVFNIGQSNKFIGEAKAVNKTIKEESEKTRLEIASVGLAVRDESEKTRDEMKKVRSDVESDLDTRFIIIEHEITRIKEAIGMK